MGPNGSGKSNISDAIRWVMGEQSVKGLPWRQGLEDVIFGGTEKRSQVGFAQVTLVLDNTEQIVEKLKAVLTAECPRSLDEATGVLSDLGHYQILSEFRTPEDYARWRMKDDGSLYVSRFCETYLDWNSLGKALMKRDGTRWSEQGTVLRDEWHCNELSENASIIRLYSPLQAELVDEEEHSSSLSSVGLISYEDDIREAIAADDILKTEKGLGDYLDNQLLKQG